MNIKLSKRSQKLSPSPLQQFISKVKKAQEEGKNIISLSVGDIFVDTPNSIKNAGIQAISQGRTKYVPPSGSLKLKRAIAKKYGAQEKEIVISSGAKSVLSAILWTLIEEGDEVLIPSPYYPPFLEVAKSCGANVRLIETGKNNFQLSSRIIEEEIIKHNIHPKLLIINTPNNPTGVTYEIDELKKINELAKKHNFLIISDECYVHHSLNGNFSFREIDKNTIIINSLSKSHAMTGWRLGWGIMPEKIAKSVRLFLENYIGCPSSISESGALAALLDEGVRKFDQERKIVLDWMKKNNIPGSPAQGGLYVFADFSSFIKKNKKIKDSLDLGEYFLEYGAALVPGAAFGDYPHHMRISFALDQGLLKEGIKRIEKALKEIK